MEIDYSEFVNAVLALLVLYILRPLLALAAEWLRAKHAELKAEIAASQYAFALEIVAQVVRAAEQLGYTGQLIGAAGDKFAWAVDRAGQELRKYNIDIDEEALCAMIEAAVYDAFNTGRQPESDDLAGEL